MAKSSTPLMFQPLVKYVQLNGRARRSEYWLFFLFQILVSIGLALLSLVMASLAGAVEVLGNIFSLAMLLPTIAVSVRRFHDINRTGWWLFFPLAVLIAALIVFLLFNGPALQAIAETVDWAGVQAEDEQAIMAMFSTLSPLFLWVGLPYWLSSLVTFIFHVTDGTKGSNRFGPDPKGTATDTSVF